MTLTREFPLLAESLLTERQVYNLSGSVNYYIWVSLINAFPHKQFELHPNILYNDCVFDLPNVTPNGLVLPKRENYLAYHEIHRAVAAVLDSCKVSTQI